MTYTGLNDHNWGCSHFWTPFFWEGHLLTASSCSNGSTNNLRFNTVPTKWWTREFRFGNPRKEKVNYHYSSRISFFYLFGRDSISVAPRTVSVGVLLGNPLVPSSAGMFALGGYPGTHQGSDRSSNDEFWRGVVNSIQNIKQTQETHDVTAAKCSKILPSNFKRTIRQEVQEAARTPARLGHYWRLRGVALCEASENQSAPRSPGSWLRYCRSWTAPGAQKLERDVLQVAAP